MPSYVLQEIWLEKIKIKKSYGYHRDENRVDDDKLKVACRFDICKVHVCLLC
jgi:hypothetical protein